MHGDKGGDGGVGDAGYRGQHPRRPHHPGLRPEPVPHQLQHLEEEAHHDGVLGAHCLHQQRHQTRLHNK